MSVFASLLRTAYRVSGAKKAFALPEDKIVPVIESRIITAAYSFPPIARLTMK